MLFDMETPGVSTKPIKLISGTSVFCETYLDNVRVDIEQAVEISTLGGLLLNICLLMKRDAWEIRNCAN